LVSSKATILDEEMTVTSWSLLSLPVMQKEAGVFAVINVWRPVDRTPFSPKDVTLISAVSARLAAVLSNLKMQEQRKHLLMTVAHEINTPLTGMLADSENLMEESPAGSDLHKLSRHNLEQVQRLHMQSETIMLVLSERAAQRQFSMHSIYRPLREARELFKSEAEFKGCRILRPRPIGGPFPDIEMLLLDLGIAIKNIIHNAVKYSFRPPPEQPTSRSVSIVGRWADQAHTQYTVAVQNYGVGISEEEITRRLIFEPYYRGEKAADRRRTGAGFGLAHARQVIEDLHHGQITVESKHVGGSAYLTTFYITLPLRQPGVLGD
jgi:signal transduction histidine kinase